MILVTAGLLLLTAVFVSTIKGEAEKYRKGLSTAVKIEKTWELPSVLNEISGIAFLGNNRIACVQDEKGSIYIYNLESSQIEQEIKFTGEGDFEGIAIDGDTAYVLENNGTIYKVGDFLSAANLETFDTFFTSKNDLEGLFLDSAENRLLLSVKLLDPQSKDQKGIYSAKLPAVEVDQNPIVKLTFEEELFNEVRKKNRGETFFPSEVAIHPTSGEILLLEAREPRLLILDPSGIPKELHRLDRKLFPQPEGLAFDESGNLYISNEGDPATIHRVTLTPN